MNRPLLRAAFLQSGGLCAQHRQLGRKKTVSEAQGSAALIRPPALGGRKTSDNTEWLCAECATLRRRHSYFEALLILAYRENKYPVRIQSWLQRKYELGTLNVEDLQQLAKKKFDRVPSISKRALIQQLVPYVAPREVRSIHDQKLRRAFRNRRLWHYRN